MNPLAMVSAAMGRARQTRTAAPAVAASTTNTATAIQVNRDRMNDFEPTERIKTFPSKPKAGSTAGS